MASRPGDSRASLTALQALLRSKYRFVPQVLEALRMVDVLDAEQGGTGLLSDSMPDRVKLYGHASLAAAWYSVESAEFAEDQDVLEIRRTHFSFTGPASPLLDADVFRAIHLPAVQDFLDILNHRVFVTYYRAWATTRPDLAEPARLQSDLIGMRRKIRDRSSGGAWSLDRGRAAMVGHLREALDVEVELVEGQPIAVTLEDSGLSGRLGTSRCALGTARLGDSAWVAESFRVDVGPIPEVDESRWRSQSTDDQLELAVTIVHQYLDPPLAWRLRIQVEPGPGSWVRLGDSETQRGARLGENAYLGAAVRPYHFEFSVDPGAGVDPRVSIRS